MTLVVQELGDYINFIAGIYLKQGKLQTNHPTLNPSLAPSSAPTPHPIPWVSQIVNILLNNKVRCADFTTEVLNLMKAVWITLIDGLVPHDIAARVSKITLGTCQDARRRLQDEDPTVAVTV